MSIFNVDERELAEAVHKIVSLAMKLGESPGEARLLLFESIDSLNRVLDRISEDNIRNEH